MNYQKLTLGELLQSRNETIKRNAVSIYKELNKNSCTHPAMVGDEYKQTCLNCGKEIIIKENPYNDNGKNGICIACKDKNPEGCTYC